MKPKNISEGNKIIAQVMGLKWKAIVGKPGDNGLSVYAEEYETESECKKFCKKINLYKKDRSEYCHPCLSRNGHPVELQYHSSWNWLMPVVEVVENTWNPYSNTCLYDEHDGSWFEIKDRSVTVFTAGFKNGERIEYSHHTEWTFNDKNEQVKREAVWLACVGYFKWLKIIQQ